MVLVRGATKRPRVTLNMKVVVVLVTVQEMNGFNGALYNYYKVLDVFD